MPTNVCEATATPGKYLTFGLAGEFYGLEVLRVQELVGLLPITRVPRLPSFVAGVVNLRGRVIPVVDLRLAFGLPASEMHDRICIVVVSVERANGSSAVMGVLVDEVSDVVDLAAGDIEDTPEFGPDIDTSFIKGVGRSDTRVLLLLDIDRALSGRELELVDLAVGAPRSEAETDTEGDS